MTPVKEPYRILKKNLQLLYYDLVLSMVILHIFVMLKMAKYYMKRKFYCLISQR